MHCVDFPLQITNREGQNDTTKWDTRRHLNNKQLAAPASVGSRVRLPVPSLAVNPAFNRKSLVGSGGEVQVQQTGTFLAWVLVGMVQAHFVSVESRVIMSRPTCFTGFKFSAGQR